uniref:Uncharacterized protein n=1 Tax=Panagrellus redivivus TaxID=6233 RepID=A0A7E4WCI3_PANRE
MFIFDDEYGDDDVIARPMTASASGSTTSSPSEHKVKADMKSLYDDYFVDYKE